MMSILPNDSIAFCTSSSGAPGLVRSPANTAVSPAISDAACSATSPSRSLIRTCAPCATSSSAVARPIPRAEPVTIADLPSSTPIAVASPCRCERSADYRSVGGSAADDDAEVLRVDGAGLAVGKRRGRMRRDADACFAVAAVEDVRAVSRRSHPRGDDRARRRQRQRSPGDVLADFVADTRAGDVADRAQPRERRGAARPDVFEVVAERHAPGVRLGGTPQARIRAQRALAGGASFAVDQAQRRATNQVEVLRGGPQTGVLAGAMRGGGGAPSAVRGESWCDAGGCERDGESGARE